MMPGVKNNNLVKKSQKICKEIMASEQIISKVIARAVVEAIRIALQTIAEARAERLHNRSGLLCKAVWSGGLFFEMSRGNYTV